MPRSKVREYGWVSGVDMLDLPIRPPTPEMVERARLNLRALDERPKVCARCEHVQFDGALAEVLAMLGLEEDRA